MNYSFDYSQSHRGKEKCFKEHIRIFHCLIWKRIIHDIVEKVSLITFSSMIEEVLNKDTNSSHVSIAPSPSLKNSSNLNLNHKAYGEYLSATENEKHSSLCSNWAIQTCTVCSIVLTDSSSFLQIVYEQMHKIIC